MHSMSDVCDEIFVFYQIFSLLLHMMTNSPDDIDDKLPNLTAVILTLFTLGLLIHVYYYVIYVLWERAMI